ncbi:hypothetical protein PFISCL1PPCAC_4576, partial [Pristionchus fissidentatus]
AISDLRSRASPGATTNARRLTVTEHGDLSAIVCLKWSGDWGGSSYTFRMQSPTQNAPVMGTFAKSISSMMMFSLETTSVSASDREIFGTLIVTSEVVRFASSVISVAFSRGSNGCWF